MIQGPNTLFEAKTQDVWVYNSELNKYLVSGNKLTNRPQILAIAITLTCPNGKFPSQKTVSTNH